MRVKMPSVRRCLVPHLPDLLRKRFKRVPAILVLFELRQKAAADEPVAVRHPGQLLVRVQEERQLRRSAAQPVVQVPAQVNLHSPIRPLCCGDISRDEFVLRIRRTQGVDDAICLGRIAAVGVGHGIDLGRLRLVHHDQRQDARAVDGDKLSLRRRSAEGLGHPAGAWWLAWQICWMVVK